ncbi:hypothetical protein [Achromobacter xylosoxidans]|uniref:hypothetical protein n=1 Tax=Alcaligenes xylosoxydans xylosoxydans TaxID=85698 RepID=UPI000760F0BB|nr:hypothetical protein [Achromobacter xylosoxidans]KWU16272.1 hypothetical protein AS148_25240 [Achromobacter xylosoxidans]
MLILVGVFLWQTPDLTGKSGEWAAWVQAFGSIGAILGAIWIAHEQHRRTLSRELLRERAETAALVRSLQAELDVAQENLEREYGDDLENRDRLFPGDLAVADVPFQIYSANSAMIGKIPNDEIRKLFVRTYGLAQSLLLSFEKNNKIDAHLTALALHPKAQNVESGFFEGRLDAGQAAVEYGNQIRDLYQTLIESKKELFRLIETARQSGEIDR